MSSAYQREADEEARLRARLMELELELAEKEFKEAEWRRTCTCSNCGEQFASPIGLRSHLRKCAPALDRRGQTVEDVKYAETLPAQEATVRVESASVSEQKLTQPPVNWCRHDSAKGPRDRSRKVADWIHEQEPEPEPVDHLDDIPGIKTAGIQAEEAEEAEEPEVEQRPIPQEVDGWESYWDGKQKRWYYYNPATDETSWDPKPTPKGPPYPIPSLEAIHSAVQRGAFKLWKVLYHPRVPVRASPDRSAPIAGARSCGQWVLAEDPEDVGKEAVTGWIKVCWLERQLMDVHQEPGSDGWILIDATEHGHGVLLEPCHDSMTELVNWPLYKKIETHWSIVNGEAEVPSDPKVLDILSAANEGRIAELKKCIAEEPYKVSSWRGDVSVLLVPLLCMLHASAASMLKQSNNVLDHVYT